MYTRNFGFKNDLTAPQQDEINILNFLHCEIDVILPSGGHNCQLHPMSHLLYVTSIIKKRIEKRD